MKTILPELHNILIIHTGGGLGDVLLSTPVISALKAQWPEANIDFLARKGTCAAIVNHPQLRSVLTIPGTEPTLAELPRWINTLRAKRYDAGIVLWSKTKIAWMLYLAGIPIRIGQDSRLAYSWTYTHPVRLRSEHEDTSSHWMEILLDYVRALGIEPHEAANKPEPLYVIPPEAHLQAKGLVADFLSSRNSAAGPVIGFHSTKGIPLTSERWPIKSFASYLIGLYQELNAKLILTGGPSEVELVNAIATQAKIPLLNLAGKTELPVLAAVQKLCQVFVCPDSGPMHLAAVNGVPTVGIYALDEDFPQRWAPVGTKNVVLRPQGKCCSIHCIKAQCPDFHCYERVSAEMIVEAVRKLL